MKTYIQLEKTAEQVNPVPTERLATMNISDCSESSAKYRFWILTATRMMPQKRTERPQMMP